MDFVLLLLHVASVVFRPSVHCLEAMRYSPYATVWASKLAVVPADVLNAPLGLQGTDLVWKPAYVENELPRALACGVNGTTTDGWVVLSDSPLWFVGHAHVSRVLEFSVDRAQNVDIPFLAVLNGLLPLLLALLLLGVVLF